MKVILEGSPEEIAALVVGLQERRFENALYDYEHGVKFTLPRDNSSGGGGG